jgi:metal-sulfur cluster biosynthetic enzyme
MASLEELREALTQVIDPELGLDVVSLGLVYRLEEADGHVQLAMTMTSPTCPLGGHLLEQARQMLLTVPGIRAVEAELVWEPRWTPERMEPRVRELLGWES